MLLDVVGSVLQVFLDVLRELHHPVPEDSCHVTVYDHIRKKLCCNKLNKNI